MRRKRPGRHNVPKINPDDLPSWMLSEDVDEFGCLYGVAEDVYRAKLLADAFHAGERLSCDEPYRAAMKALARLNNEDLPTKERTAAGLRAARKFWEAKVAARRSLMRGRK